MFKKISFFRLLSLSVLLNAGALHAEVTIDTLHSFNAGEPAVASQVNENFQALASAINGIKDRLDGVDCSSAITENLDFKFFSFGVGIGGGSSFMQAESDIMKGDLCIKTDGTLSLKDTNFHWVEVVGPPASFTKKDIDPGDSDPDGDLQTTDLYYTLNNGCVFKVGTTSGFTDPMMVFHMNSSMTMGVGGSGDKNELCEGGIDCASGSDQDVGDSYFKDIIVLVRKGSGATYCDSL